jgi:DNA-binding MarR family transcriptional regulator
MSGKVAKEIQQARAFTCSGEEAFLNLARTFEFLHQELSELFRFHNLSFTQYNMLRILRGAGVEGLNCSEASRRMISHDPDITRLFDRLESRGLIHRVRTATDRRVVRATISPAGLELLGLIDQPILELHTHQMRNLSPEQVEQLISLLEMLRP